MFPLLMCDACRAVRSGPGPEPDELVVHPNLREPYLQWGCRWPAATIGPSCRGCWRGTRRPSIPSGAATFDDGDQAQRADLCRVVYRRQDA
jgi:hypothetical protein